MCRHCHMLGLGLEVRKPHSAGAKDFDSRLSCQLPDPGATRASFVFVKRSDNDDLSWGAAAKGQ